MTRIRYRPVSFPLRMTKSVKSGTQSKFPNGVFPLPLSLSTWLCVTLLALSSKITPTCCIQAHKVAQICCTRGLLPNDSTKTNFSFWYNSATDRSTQRGVRWCSWKDRKQAILNLMELVIKTKSLYSANAMLNDNAVNGARSVKGCCTTYLGWKFLTINSGRPIAVLIWQINRG